MENRLIPVLLIDAGRCVKSFHFKNYTYLGDPINIIRIFNELEVDELIIKSISGLLDKEFLGDLSSEAFMPLSYGGGIETFDQAANIFSLGFEKLIFRSTLFSNPALLSKISQEFGAQALAISCDVAGTQLKLNPAQFTQKVNVTKLKSYLSNLQIGELMLTSVDRDGTGIGPDISLLRLLRKEFRFPITYAGGVSSVEEINKLVENGASAVACSKYFMLHGKQNGVLIWYPSTYNNGEI